MVINGVSFFGGDMSAPTALPFFVCVAGFCITNVRGFEDAHDVESFCDAKSHEHPLNVYRKRSCDNDSR